MSKHQVVIPRITEKAALHAGARTYVFQVPADLNKQQIAAAVAAQHDVTVTTVNTLLAKGKTTRSAVKRGKAFYKGKHATIKKAYVTVAEGQRIKEFEEEQ